MLVQCSVPIKGEITIAEKLFDCNATVLEKSLCYPIIRTPTENITQHVSVEQAFSNRFALIKSVYGRMLDWLVKRINESLASKDVIKNFYQCFGYCTNERLQQFFNHHIFKKEQEEYLKEKIEWSLIDFGLKFYYQQLI